MNTVNEIAIRIAADVAALRSSMREAETTVAGSMRAIEEKISSVNNALGLFGAGLSAAATVAFVKNAIDTADVMDELSQKVGVSVEQLSGLQVAFKFGGVEAEALQSAMTKLATAASNGNDGLKALGLSTKSFASSRDLLAAVADKFEGISDGAEKTALAVEIFGKSGANLIPILNGGSEGLAKYDDLAKKLGLTLSSEAAAKAAEFNDKLDEISLALSGTSIQLTQTMIPALLEMAGGFNQLLLDLPELTAAFVPYLAGGAVTVAMTTMPGLITAIATAITTRLVPAMVVLAPQVAAFTAAAAAIGFVISRINDSSNRLSDLESASRQISILNKQIQETEQIIADGRGSSVSQSRLKSLNAELVKATAVINVFKKEAADNQSYADLLGMVDQMFAKKTKTFEGLNKQGKDFQKIVDDIKSTLNEENATLELTLKLGRSLTDSEKERIKITQRLGGVMTEEIDQLLIKNKALEESVQKQEELKKVLEKVQEIQQKAADAAQKETEQIAGRTKQLEAEIDQIGLKSEALAELTAKSLEAQAAEKRRIANANQDADDPTIFFEYIKQATELEKQANLVRIKSVKEVAQARIVEEEKANKQLAQDLERAFGDAILKGDSITDALRKTIRSQTFKVNFEGAFDGLAKQIKTIVNQVTESIDGVLGKGATSALAIGYGDIKKGLDEGFFQGTQAAGGAIIGEKFGGPIGAAIGAKLGATLGKFSDKVLGIRAGETRQGQSFRLQDGQIIKATGPSGGSIAESETKAATIAAIESINDAFKKLGSDTFVTSFLSGLESSDKNRGGVFSGGTLSSGARFGETRNIGAVGGFESQTATSLNSGEAFKAYVEDLNQAFLQALQTESANFDGNIKEFLSGLGDVEALNGSSLENAILVVQQLDFVNDNFKNLGGNLSALAGATSDTVFKFFEAVGGLESLGAGLGNFNQKFLSEAEKQEMLLGQVTRAFTELNLELPDSRDEFKNLVQSQDLLTASGAQTFASLLKLTDSVDALYPAAEEATRVLNANAEAQERMNRVSERSARLARERAEAETRASTLADALAAIAESETSIRGEVLNGLADGLTQFEITALTSTDSIYSSFETLRRLLEQGLIDPATATSAAERLAEFRRATSGIFSVLADQLADYQRRFANFDTDVTAEFLSNFAGQGFDPETLFGRLRDFLADDLSLAAMDSVARLRTLSGTFRELNALTNGNIGTGEGFNDLLAQLETSFTEVAGSNLQEALDMLNLLPETIGVLNEAGNAVVGFDLRDRLEEIIRTARESGGVDTSVIDQERKRLEEELLQLQGDTVEIRRREREAINEVNRELYDRIQSLRQEQRIAAEREGLEVRLLQAQGNTAALRERELAALDASNRATLGQIFALEDQARAAEESARALDAAKSALQRAIDAERSTLQATIDRANDAENALRTAYDAEKDRLQLIIDGALEATDKVREAYDRQSQAAQEMVDKFKGFNQQVKDLRRTLSEQAFGAQPEVAQANFASVIQRALTGDESAFGQLDNAASTYIDSLRNTSSDYVSFVKSFAQVQGQLGVVEGFTGNQVSVAEQQLQTLKDQVRGIITLDESVLSVEEAVREAQEALASKAQAEAQLAILNAQVGSLIDINESVLSLDEATRQLVDARAAAEVAEARMLELDAIQNQYLESIDAGVLSVAEAIRNLRLAGGGGGGSPMPPVPPTTQQPTQNAGPTGSADLLAAVAAFNNGNATAEQLATIRADLNGFATGGYVSGPGTGTSDSIMATLSNGEFVMNAMATRRIGVSNLNMMNQGSMPNNNEALVAEIRALRAEVKQLREDNSRENRSSILYQSKTAQVLTKVSENGSSLYTESRT